mgnify:CR=1 FL=1
MAESKQKVLKNAAKYVKKGQYEKAIEEYRKLNQEDYGEASLNNAIGDLLLQIKDTKEALVEYEKAARYYEDKGFIPRAMAIYKKILRYDPGLTRIYEKLAQLYSDQGLIQDAISQYEFLARHHEHEGNTEAALDSYRQIADLDPSNLAIREQLAGLYSKQGFREKASAERVKIGERFVKKGDMFNAIKSFESALKEQPNNENAMRGIVSVYLAEKRVSEARDVLNRILEGSPENTMALVTLGRICMESGELDEAVETYQKVLSIDPSQEGVNEILGTLYIKKGNYPEAFRLLKEIIQTAIEHEDYQKALGILDQLQAIEPKNIAIREKKSEIYQKLNRDADLKKNHLEVAELYYEKGRLEEAYNIYDRLFAMDPNDVSVKQRFNQISIEFRGRPIEISKLVEQPTFESLVKETSSSKTEVLELGSDDFEIDHLNSLESIFDTSEIEKITLPVFSQEVLKDSVDMLGDQIADDIFAIEGDEKTTTAAPTAAKLEPTEENIREFRIEAGVFVKYGLFEKAADRLKSILVMDPDDEESLDRLIEVYEKLGQQDLIVQTMIRRSDVSVKRNNIREATDILNRAQSLAPKNEIIQDRLTRLRGGAGDAQFVPTGDTAAFVSEMGSSDMQPLVDLSAYSTEQILLEKNLDAVLNDSEDGVRSVPTAGAPADGLTNDLADVVKEFREELISRTDTRDVDTHYNLGIAYMEMGLIDEAIEEFKLTVDYPGKTVEGSSLLGQCYIQKLEFPKAITVLSRALKSDSLLQPQLLSLKYDLAAAKRMNDEFDEALAILKEIQSLQPKYRDVPGLIQELE